MTLTVNNKTIDKTSTQYFGGYKAYFQLYFQLWRMYFKNKTIFTKWQRFHTIVVMIVKTPWWLLIKPLGSVFSVKTHLRGTYLTENDVLIEFSEKFFTTVWFLRIIPFFCFWSHKGQEKVKGTDYQWVEKTIHGRGYKRWSTER